MIALPLHRRVSPDVLQSLQQVRDTALRDDVRLATEHMYYTFAPRPDDPANYDQQWSFVHDTTSKFAILLGGTGAGKTIAAAWKTANYVLETVPPVKRCPFWIMGEYMDQICQVAWVEKLSTLIPETEILDIQWHLAKRRWPQAVMLRHPIDREDVGWILDFRSYQQGIGAIKAVSIGGYWLNEEVPFEQVFEVQGRCRDYDSPGWADFTPIECKSARWPEAYESPPEGWRFYHVNTELNTAIDSAWTKRYLANIPEELRDTRRIGAFTTMMGQVYKEYRRSIHVIEPFDIPRDWYKLRGLDFGYSNEFCCLWVAKDRDGRYYVYDEHYASQKAIDDHVHEINRRFWSNSDPYYGPTYSDHDGTWRNELGMRGIACTMGYKGVLPGIECLRSLMMPQIDGKPRLFIFNTCVNLIRELPNYRWPQGTSTRNPSEHPVDKDNHALDAMRYAVYTDFLKSKSHGNVIQKGRTVLDPKRRGVQLAR